MDFVKVMQEQSLNINNHSDTRLFQINKHFYYTQVSPADKHSLKKYQNIIIFNNSEIACYK
jgi:hypothetical protein